MATWQAKECLPGRVAIQCWFWPMFSLPMPDADTGRPTNTFYSWLVQRLATTGLFLGGPHPPPLPKFVTYSHGLQGESLRTWWWEAALVALGSRAWSCQKCHTLRTPRICCCLREKRIVGIHSVCVGVCVGLVPRLFPSSCLLMYRM